jgi:hypothetical protein
MTAPGEGGGKDKRDEEGGEKEGGDEEIDQGFFDSDELKENC